MISKSIVLYTTLKYLRLFVKSAKLQQNNIAKKYTSNINCM